MRRALPPYHLYVLQISQILADFRVILRTPCKLQVLHSVEWDQKGGQVRIWVVVYLRYYPRIRSEVFRTLSGQQVIQPRRKQSSYQNVRTDRYHYTNLPNQTASWLNRRARSEQEYSSFEHTRIFQTCSLLFWILHWSWFSCTAVTTLVNGIKQHWRSWIMNSVVNKTIQ
jgi:hypothetical protein